MKVLDVVRLATTVAKHGLKRGMIGTIVEKLAPGVFEVEFCDNQGRTIAMVPLRSTSLQLFQKKRLVSRNIRELTPAKSAPQYGNVALATHEYRRQRMASKTQYLVTRLEYQNPEIYARLQKGEFPNVIVAAKEAGILRNNNTTRRDVPGRPAPRRPRER